MAEAEKQAESNGGGSSGATEMIVSALKSKELLVPAALSAAGALVATKGPGLFHKMTDAAEEKGEQEAQDLGQKAAEGAKQGLTSGKGGIAGKAVSKILPGGGGGGGGGGKKTRRLPIQRWTDVAVSVEQAYEAWTKFDDYPKFMHRVVEVREEGNDKLKWQEKIWFSKRQWEGKVTDRRKNDRIAWKTTSGMSHKGVVSFHKLDDNLTRVMVDMEFEPSGMMEKMASGLRFVKRAVQADLARFKAFVEMEDAKGIQYRDASKDESDESQSDDDRDSDGDRDSGREERERARQERRETAGASS
jgi:ribosome-associated toxin RatA of RatAB toxin-antitoxin module